MSTNTALLPHTRSSAAATLPPNANARPEPQAAVPHPTTPASSDRAAAAQASSSTAPATAQKQPVTRRSTLASRFPLLRKSSGSHVRTTSSSHALPTSFLAPAAPRASTSSSRGRIDTPTPDLRSRESSTSASIRSSREPDSTASDRSRSALSAASIPNTSLDSEPTGKLDKLPQPTKAAKAGDKKMHQTSSRLLRMTDDERPYTRDFKDLFSTLMVSLPLTPHRVRFRMIDFTFTSDEAITNLGSLKFSQSNRMPDPKDASRVVTTTTTTTFSMAKEMARSVCTRFYEAKFIESVEGKFDFNNKSSVWQLTPKGIHILERFCARNGIQSTHVKSVIESNRNPHQLVILERSTDTDKLHHDEQTVEIIFRRFVGNSANETSSDSDSIHEFGKCDVGVRTIKHKPTQSRPYEHTFNGRSAAEWLMDCSTMVDRREAIEICSMFLQLGLIAPVDARNSSEKFQPAKQVQYYITQHGERIAGWNLSEDTTAPADLNAAKARDGAARDSNSNRTNVIIRNPSWRLLYREFLKETMCEENLSFYIEVQDFNSQYRAAVNATGDNKIETIRETLAAAYGLYNAFLAPGSPNELNIDHALRTQLATRMTRAVGDDTAMMQSLVEVASLFEKAQNSIFKLMSSDSVPKFIKHPKYGPQLRGLDAAAAAAYAATSGTSARA
ncbi:AMSH/STAMBP protein ubiquitin specific-protease [Didymosphaeria variabile]|uniref:AMSH/STAMBP protein ubiquitin specific-protease n=1 Tax=Didymosphaeria variabile TaxID=1932322 RepID=A0A9W8XRQ4_9PLEO|nr:AMSH/STAMBP protein ubiquitin specific-protease [Didymosphaeria variabile]KAJ4357895.1 AMSH/STAMBP protein ubiquitin specific-protease [Didymosphaeria variabile]